MDGSNFVTPAMRYDHLQRLLKQYELEALSSLRGPAMLSGAVDSVSRPSSAAMTSNAAQLQTQSQAVGAAMTTSLVEKTALSSLFNAASTLYRQDKTIDNAAPPSTITRRGGESDGSTTAERLPNTERSVLQQQETLLKEILAFRSAIPVQPLPILMPQDRTTGTPERKETLLEGEVITCFAVGGEKRLCLPQVLNTVLKHVSMVDINRACTELNIHCGYCTPEQLLVLKIASVVSATTAQCALITKTDAERLCDYLLRQKRKEYRPVTTHGMASSLNSARSRSIPYGQHQNSSGINPASITIQKQNLSARHHMGDGKEITSAKAERDISVMHYCFGRCRGLYRPSLYASPSAECIECNECGHLFAPDRFVVHSHGNQERRTCHWGFDSANWRAYLHLTDDEECEENAKILDEMKLRFDITGLTRRQMDEVVDGSCGEAKRMAETDDVQPSSKRPRLDAGDQNIITKEMTEKPTVPSTSSGSLLPGLDPTILPYILCDPLILTAHYQAALAAATVTLRAAANSNTASNTSIVPPSLLPQLMMGPALQASQKLPPSAIGGASQSVDGFGMKTGILPVQPRHQETQLLIRDRPLLDEATAAAALKLLQLHAGGADDYCFGKITGSMQAPESQKSNQPTSWTDEKTSGFSTSMKPSQQHSASFLTFGKEPFKKQLLHLFTAEQQHKEQQRLEGRLKEFPSDADLSHRGSVEIIVNDDERESAQQRPNIQRLPATAPPHSESEKMEANVGTPDTQVADELSVSSSDNESANGDLSLDDLLRRYITDPDGLKVVRAKIAENQRYLEQKLDAVSAENRMLHGECVQLRTKQLQLRQQQENTAMAAANLLGKGGIGNLMGLLPKQFSM